MMSQDFFLFNMFYRLKTIYIFYELIKFKNDSFVFFYLYCRVLGFLVFYIKIVHSI